MRRGSIAVVGTVGRGSTFSGSIAFGYPIHPMSKAWNEIAGDFSQGKREAKEGEYSIVAAGGVGRVVCTVSGVQLIDFYRTTTVLIVNKKEDK